VGEDAGISRRTDRRKADMDPKGKITFISTFWGSFVDFAIAGRRVCLVVALAQLLR
jgi:hypothetical protein